MRDCFAGAFKKSLCRKVTHHESWNNWLLELGFEGMHQLFSFGIVERQHTWREGNTRISLFKN